VRANNAYQDGNSYRFHKGIRAQEDAKNKPRKTKLDLEFEFVLSFLARLINPGRAGK
jgi:hypothetical protein